MPRSGPLVIGLMYPPEWEVRPAAEHDDDVARLAAVDPRVEIVDVRYVEPYELRTRRGADPHYREVRPPLSAEQRSAFERVEVVLAQDLPFDVHSVAPRLRWVQGMGAGVSHLASSGLAEAGIALTTAAGVNAVSISEFVFGRLLQAWKRFAAIDGAQAAHDWTPLYGREAAGCVLGVVGLGAIGRQVARRGRAFGMTVLATRRSARPGSTDPDADELLPPERLGDLLARSDAVVAAVPETPETQGLFDGAAFGAMRRGAWFCNVGRGSAVVEEALVEALVAGHLSGAAIDVVRDEPLPADSPLWDTPNLSISAHSATSVDRFWPNLYALFRENLGRYLSGEPLRNRVE